MDRERLIADLRSQVASLTAQVRNLADENDWLKDRIDELARRMALYSGGNG